jgi:hypothetical protein
MLAYNISNYKVSEITKNQPIWQKKGGIRIYGFIRKNPERTTA